MSRSLQLGEKTAFLPLLVANLFPLAGIAFLEWHPEEVLFVYWLEIGSFVVLYSGLVLFAKRESRPADRNIDPLSFSLPFVNARETPIQPFDRVPAVYPRNVRYAIGLFVWGLVFWWCLAVLMVLMPARATLELSASGEGVPIGDVVSIIGNAFSPAILVNACLLFVSQLVTIRREFFGRRRHERLSAATIAELPIRVILFWFLLTIFAQLVFPLLLWPIALVFDTATVTEVGVSTLVIAGKLTIEWATRESQWSGESSGIARFFTPENPHSSE
ncbi:DUF6498-containing protein [Halostagnicola kamekurae]|uniref:Uncharacterized protein n=1 Tax=Halostagnicola kamekurae TaxID=619731 RepID=A0A1I6RQR1_9EURY|nr:DUF6498-containing protein [Halostagnicola kamekurae]SFS67024.1 hypothetical protein SAMN04488556_2000 [Halostagnicola kamekurae]